MRPLREEIFLDVVTRSSSPTERHRNMDVEVLEQQIYDDQDHKCTIE